jgi:two-component system response regulator
MALAAGCDIAGRQTPKAGVVSRGEKFRPMTPGHILLVEDNEDDADLTLRAFKRSNILNEVYVARDGAEALDYLFGTGAHAGKPPGVPALMILDLNLPKISGLEVLRRTRANEQTRFLPTVILTTSVEDEDVINSYALGANAYVQKPVAFEDFLSAAAKLGMFWLLVNVRPPPGSKPAV